MLEYDPSFASTMVSGEVLKKLPIGRFINFARHDGQLVIVWENGTPTGYGGRLEYFNVLTGQKHVVL